MTEAMIDDTGKLKDYETPQGTNPRIDFWEVRRGLDAIDALMRKFAEFGKAPDPNEFEVIWWAFRRTHADAGHLQTSLEKAKII